MPIPIVGSFFHAEGQGSRSTALNSLQWLIAGLSTATVTSAIWVPSPAAWILFAMLDVVSVIAFFVAYFYFMFKSPSMLRSEHYELQKTMIDKGMIGDNLLGIKESGVPSAVAGERIQPAFLEGRQ